MNNYKEKAEELFERYKYEIGDNCQNSSYCTKKSCQTENGIFCFVDKQTAKQCALICVDEIIVSVKYTFPSAEFLNYWQQVKTEIEKL